MGETTSRRHILGAAVAGAVGTASVVALTGGGAGTRLPMARLGSEPLVAWIEDPTSGVLQLMIGGTEVAVRDADLVARILGAAGGN